LPFSACCLKSCGFEAIILSRSLLYSVFPNAMEIAAALIFLLSLSTWL